MHSTLLQHRYLASAAVQWAAPVLLACAASPATAAIVLDQEAVTVVQPGNGASVFSIGEVPPPPSLPNNPSVNQQGVQTFTAGTAGRLSRIEFQATTLGATPPQGLFLLSLIDGDFSAGANAVFGQSFVEFASVPNLSVAQTGVTGLIFDTSAFDYRIVPGQRFSVLFQGIPFLPNQSAALVIGQATRPGIAPRVFTGTNYAGGRFFFVSNGSVVFSTPSDLDVGFRSYVETLAAVPEPASWAMMIAGFGLIGAVMRRRRVAEGAGGAEAGARA